MAVKVFLDANILLDYILAREHYRDAEHVMQLIANGKVDAFITTSVLHITSYWVSKAYGAAETKKVFLSMLEDILVIDTPHNTTLIALHSQINDIEDALQYYAAIHHKLDYFISRDKRLKRDGLPALPVLTPDEFIRVIA
jgi:predicted nucleic acid-binding protein